MTDNVRTKALFDILLVIATAAIVQAVMHQMLWKYASLFAAAAALALTTGLIHRRDLTWAAFGLRWPNTVRGTLLLLGQAALAMVVVMVAGAFLALWLDQFLTRPASAGDRFAGLTGNIPLFAFWLAAGWLVGGFVEEMVFRGFLVTRFETLLTGREKNLGVSLASVLAVVLAATLFGGAHYYYRGLHGAIVLGVMGALFGLFYLLFGRKLWPLILAHGTFDTLGLTAEFLNADW